MIQMDVTKIAKSDEGRQSHDSLVAGLVRVELLFAIVPSLIDQPNSRGTLLGSRIRFAMICATFCIVFCNTRIG